MKNINYNLINLKIPTNFIDNKNHNPRKSLVGQQFENITILSIAGYVPEGHSKRTIYECQCECGNTFLARGKDIEQNKIKSCGCFHKERTKQMGLNNKKEKGQSALNIKFYRYRSAAKRRNLEFSLNIEEFKNLLIGDCFYCEAPPKMSALSYSVTVHGQLPINGIDRVDNTKGYTIDNCVSCCRQCNQAKMDYSLENFTSWIERVQENLQNKGLLTSQTSQKEKEEKTT